MLLRVIIAVVFFVVVAVLVRRVRAMFGTAGQRRTIEAKMARCARCGVYYPRDDGVTRNGRVYCSAAHAQQDTES